MSGVINGDFCTTGHILYENDLGYQTRVCGAAMPQLRYLHNPELIFLAHRRMSI